MTLLHCYHDDGEVNRALPGDGLLQFVLIDATGKIAFETSGVDEHELLTALTHLGFDIRTSAREEHTADSPH